MAKTQGLAMTADVNAAERTPSPPVRAEVRRLAIEPPPDREKAFAKARRRSAWVRRLRATILVGGLGTVAAIIGIAIFNPFATKLGGLSFSNLSLDGTKITMDRPRLSGFRNDGQPYLLTAQRALQDIKQPTVVGLEKVDGEIGMAHGESTHLSADSGAYDSLSEHMDLSNNVRISNSHFNVLLRSAAFDFKSGVYRSDEPVEVQIDGGTTIFGDKGEARNNGQELTFEGHVRTKIVPKTEAETAGNSKRIDP